jgi:hypothetical protein
MTKQEMNKYYQRQWREKNPERVKDAMRRYYVKNRDALNSKNRERNYKKYAAGKWPTKWILVDDFLPDEGVPVLAYIRFTEEYFPGEDYGILIWDGETWSGGEWNDAPVTHWARLPKPPKEG